MMGQVVVSGAQLSCSFGLAPSSLTVLPVKRCTLGGMPIGTITDTVPMVNIKPFGMCTSLANPSVASATAAALGVLTPMPCVPATSAPWTAAAPTTTVDSLPVLATGCTTTCAWGGVVQVVSPGQFNATAT